MALLLVMDSASPTLLSRARQGQPLAIATLVHQALDNEHIDVTAWKRQGLLYVDLMSFERLIKADMLPILRETLAEICPKSIRGIKISSYIYGEDMACWMERWGSAQSLVAETVAVEEEVIHSPTPLPVRLEAQFKALLHNVHRHRLATAGVATFVILATALGLSLNSPETRPSLAEQDDRNGEVKTRRTSATP